MTPNEFIESLKEQHLVLSDLQLKQFKDYLTFLIDYNQKVNLTAITDPADIWIKHFYDSITPLFFLPISDKKFSMIDVGSGAGFPSVPLKIFNSKIDLTLLDSLQKRIDFLDLLIEKLSLTSVHTLHGRAEDFGQDRIYREKFDFAIARAVANTNTLLELLLPFLKIGGKAILMKSEYSEKDLSSSKKALLELGGRFNDIFSFDLPNGDRRSLVIIDKVAKSKNKYPRKAGTPKRSPIGGKNG
ncbi:16S rRNA (guanine(527)-N(7))-methyltransferase RsmG [Oenococcus alcoholitolerans]|uniref:Ribosomal RNA small subunit methyltransferase G n=1 Tax=Oenococcus alcoholitolerans TaxID=931074 RepID=A0ABR4XSI6_9LACO|nr:16S rRNA methyltransferase [Oenococcus alcoholitolerans]